jgi:hypothetical protein
VTEVFRNFLSFLGRELCLKTGRDRFVSRIIQESALLHADGYRPSEIMSYENDCKKILISSEDPKAETYSVKALTSLLLVTDAYTEEGE